MTKMLRGEKAAVGALLDKKRGEVIAMDSLATKMLTVEKLQLIISTDIASSPQLTYGEKVLKLAILARRLAG